MMLSTAFALMLALAPAGETTDLARDGLRGDETLSRRDPIVQLPNPSSEIELRYRVTATDARLNRRLMGPPRRFVQGVPAEPVDSFAEFCSH